MNKFMRKYILSLIFLTMMCSLNAQIVRSVKYDFTNPPTLNPAMPMLEPHSYDIIALDDIQFIAGPIVVSFHNPDRSAAKLEDVGSGTSVLSLYRGQYMDIEAKVDELKEIRFYGRQIGDLGKVLGTSGTSEFLPHYSHWVPDTDFHLAQFQNTGQTSMLDSIVVYYTVTQNVLTPILSTLKESDVLNSFKEMQLTFSDNVKITDAAEFSLKDSQGNIIPLTGKAEGIYVTLSLSNAVTEPGSYSLIIKDGSIATLDGILYNNTINIPFVIELPKNSFDYATISLLPGEVSLIPTTIDLTFAGTVAGVDVTKEAQLIPDGSSTPVCSYIPSITGVNKVTLTSNILFPIESTGTYDLKIPEAMVFDVNYKDDESHGVESNGAFYNPAKTLRYYVNVSAPKDPEPEPEPETVIASAEILESANNLLNLSGVGYPSAESEARKKIAALLEIAKSTDDQYRAAFDEYYNATDIELPEEGKTYRIINLSKNGTKTYLAYSNSTISLTSNISEAYRFEAKQVGDKFAFVTEDGKYLHTLVNTDTYSVTKKANVLAEQNDYTALSISKFTFSTIKPANALGLVSISGKVGEKNGINFNYYSMINTAAGEIDMLDPDTKYMDDQYSSAFMIVRSDRPFKPYVAEYTISPTSGTVSDLEEIVITFPSLTGVTYDSNKAITLKNSSGSVMQPKSFDAIGGNGNAFSIKYLNLARDSYTLNVPKGAFMCGKDTIQALTANYIVANGYEFNTDFVSTWYYQVGTKEVSGSKTYTRELNEIMFFDYEWYGKEIYVNENAQIRLYDLWQDKVIGYGRLEKAKIPIKDSDNYYPAVKIVWEKTYYEGSLPTDMGGELGYTYKIYIPEGAIGDKNYASYLADPSSVRKTDCHINSQYEKLIYLYPDVPFETAYTLAPEEGKVETLDSVVVSFPKISNVDFLNKKPITLTNESGDVITARSVEVQGKFYNMAVIRFMNVDKGVYSLNIPKGSFVSHEDTIQTITATYDVLVGCPFQYNIASNVKVNVGSATTKIITTDINDIVLYDESWIGEEIFVNENAVVQLLDEEKNVVGTGKLTTDKVSVDVNGNLKSCPAIRVKWNKTYAEGDLVTRKESYGCDFELVIPEASYGNKTYAQYLQDPENVKKSECRVNADYSYKMTICPEAPFEVTYALTPGAGTVQTLDEIVVKFDGIKDVGRDASKAVFLIRTSDSAVILPSSISSINEDRNEFSIKFINVDKGTYILGIPAGTFFYRNETIQEIQATYVVEVGAQMNTDFAQSLIANVNGENVDESAKYYTADLNNLSFYDVSWTSSQIYYLDTEVVSLVDADGKVVRAGKLEPTVKSISQAGMSINFSAFNIVWNPEFESGSIPTSTGTIDGSVYKVVVAKESFGDENFYKYLQSPSTISKADCHANAEYSFSVKVYPDPIQIADISNAIDDYISDGSSISIADITDLIEKYLNQ